MDLLRTSRSDRVFLTHAWFRCWWDAFGDDGQLFVVCVRRGGRLVGVAPLRLTRSRFRGFPVRKLSFLANAYTEEADFIVAGPEGRVVQAILAHLARPRRAWDILDLSRVRETSALWEHLPDAAPACGLSFVTRPDICVPYISITASWKEFLGRRSRNFRKTLNKRRNAIGKSPEHVRVELLASPDEINGALPEMVQVSSRSWKAERQRALGDKPSDLAFIDRLSTELGARGWLNIWMLRHGETPVAYEYHLKYRDVTSPIRADFDEAHRAIAPGAYLEYSIIHSLFDDPKRNVREYNTCADAYAYELRWTDNLRAHSRAWVFAPSWYGKALRALGGLRRPHRKGRKTTLASCRTTC